MLLYQLVTILFIFVSTILHFTIVSAEDCPKISHPGEEVGRISDPRIKEGSGLVASHTYPDIFWTLNDHNGLNHVFAVSTKLNGTVVTDLKLAGSENVDWEAIATAPCSKEYVPCSVINHYSKNLKKNLFSFQKSIRNVSLHRRHWRLFQ